MSRPAVLAAVIAVLVAGGVGTALVLGDGDGDGGATGAPATTAPRVDVDAGAPRDPEDAAPTTIAPTTTTAEALPLDEVGVRLERVADLEAPTAMAVRRGDDRLWIAERGGRVVVLGPGGDREVALDLRDDVTAGGEQGLLGLAFNPDGGFLYVDYTDGDGDTRVVEYAMGDGLPDPATARIVLTVDQPYANHNGGMLAFGPDGFLRISLGDGGSGGDPEGHGQNLGTLLGSILRIHPRPSGDAPYAVPSDNPFVDRPEARDEIWAHGLRNPWRFSFDRATGDLWIGDVGQNRIEEVDFEPADSGGGRNYGWNRLEGSESFAGAPPSEHVLPVHEYPLAGGNCAVTGGYVYRGSAVPGLGGAYLFGDFCAGEIMALRQEGGEVVELSSLDISVDQLASFGEDADGELYALSLAGPVFKIVPRT